MCPIDATILSIKSVLLKNFVAKWSKHHHDIAENCKITITMDGLWKDARMKCCYEDQYFQTQFGDIQIGCIKSPKPYSYYCDEHQDASLSFIVDDRIMQFKPKDIVSTKIYNC